MCAPALALRGRESEAELCEAIKYLTIDMQVDSFKSEATNFLDLLDHSATIYLTSYFTV